MQRTRWLVGGPIPAEFDDDLAATIKHVGRSTMVSPRRLAAVCDAVEYVERAQIPGAIVECGVWRGGAMAAAARTLVNAGTTERELWLYDTFAGMTEPTAEDQRSPYDWYSAPSRFHRLMRSGRRWHAVSEDAVRATVVATGYPAERIRCVVGPVEETIPDQMPDRIAVLRLDTDWYRSTLHELSYLYPRLMPGGILLLDDYGHYAGARRAVDEYFDKHGGAPFLHRTDYTGRSGVKP